MADIEKIQPIGDTEQYTLRARTDSNGNVITSYYLPLKTASGLKENSGGGSSSYFKLATLVITGGYINRPIVFELSRRGYGFQKLEIMFASNSTNDPSLNYIRTDGEDLGFWINKTATSTWEVYGRYSESYGSCTVHRITGSATDNGVTVTLNLENIGTTQPEGTQARRGYSARYADIAVTLDSNAGSSTVPIYFSGGKPVQCSTTLGVNITGSSASCTGNAASATKLQTARNIWGKSFNGTADISGDMTNVGPGMYLPSGQSRFQFLTSGGGAGNGYFGKVGCCGTYATIDSNIGSHSFYNNGTSRVDGTIYRPNSTLGNSWIGSRGLPYSVIAVDASDSASSVAYTLEAIKFQTNTYGMCAERAGETYGITGWKNSRTANGYDAYFYVSKDCYFRCSTRVYGAVWNDYAEKRYIPEAQQDWIDEECAANPLAGRCVREVGDDTMVLSTERMQKGCKIISDTFGFSIGETEDCKTPIAVSGRVLAYLLEDKEIAKEHIGDFVCSGPDGTVSIMTTEEYFKCPQAVVGTISAVPEYETWGTGNVKVDGRIWIYVR